MSITFGKTQTEGIKGIAILTMILHHMLLIAYQYRAAASFSVSDLILCISAKICVSLFVFVSGYGLFCANKGLPLFIPQLKRAVKFFIPFWITCSFTIIGLILFEDLPQSMNAGDYLLSYAGFSTKLNGSWWYIAVYLEFLLVLPLFHYLLRGKTILILAFSLLIYSCSPESVVPFGFILLQKTSLFAALYREYYFSQFAFWQIIFVTGYLFARHNLFSRINVVGRAYSVVRFLLVPVAITVVLALRLLVPKLSGESIFVRPLSDSISLSTSLDMFLIPIVIFLLLYLAGGSFAEKQHGYPRRFFLFFGAHSMNIWLVHSFFDRVLVARFDFSGKVLLLGLIVLFLSTLYSLAVSRITAPLIKRIR